FFNVKINSSRCIICELYLRICQYRSTFNSTIKPVRTVYGKAEEAVFKPTAFPLVAYCISCRTCERPVCLGRLVPIGINIESSSQSLFAKELFIAFEPQL